MVNPEKKEENVSIMSRYFLLLPIIGLVGTAADACTVPVYEYALFNWAPDPYAVIVFHHGPLDKEQQATVAWMKEEAGKKEGRHPNARIMVVDTADSVPGELAPLWKSCQKEPLPLLVAAHPVCVPFGVAAWKGPLTLENARALFDSKVRREVADRLQGGDAFVWLLVTTDDPDANNRAQKIIEDGIQKTREAMKSTDMGPVPEIALITLSRNDPQEQPLVQMLLKTEPDLAERPGPFAFPIYGRGRAYFALVGKGISAGNVERTHTFLTGECSCVIKEDSPGMDLLMTADWSAIPKNLPAIAGLTPITAPTASETVETPPACPLTTSQADTPAVSAPPVPREALAELDEPSWAPVIAGVLVAVFLVIAGVSFFLYKF